MPKIREIIFIFSLVIALVPWQHCNATGPLRRSGGSDKSQKAKRLGKPPSGYSWLYVKEIKGFLLRPNKWYVHKENNSQSGSAIRLTKNKSDLDTGFSLSCSPGAFRTHLEEENMERTLNDLLLKLGVDPETVRENGNDPLFKSYTFTDVTPSKSGIQIKSTVFLSIALQTGTLYIASIQAPVKNWETESKLLLPIISEMALDPAF